MRKRIRRGRAGRDCVEKHRIPTRLRKDIKRSPTRGRYIEDIAAEWAEPASVGEERMRLEVEPGSRSWGARWKG